MSRLTTLALAGCLVLACISSAMAQGGGGGGGGGRGGRGGGGGGGGPGARGMDGGLQLGGGNQFHQANQGGMAGQALQNQNANQQNMPSVAQLAAMLIANYDADGNGGLDATELQSALTALRGVMMSNNQQNGMNGPANNANMNAFNPPPRRRN